MLGVAPENSTSPHRLLCSIVVSMLLPLVTPRHAIAESNINQVLLMLASARGDGGVGAAEVPEVQLACLIGGNDGRRLSRHAAGWSTKFIVKAAHSPWRARHAVQHASTVVIFVSFANVSFTPFLLK